MYVCTDYRCGQTFDTLIELDSHQMAAQHWDEPKDEYNNDPWFQVEPWDRRGFES